MILDKREIHFIKTNRAILQKILDKLIADRTNQVIEIDDPEKREKLVNWVRELKSAKLVVSRFGEEKDNFTGI